MFQFKLIIIYILTFLAHSSFADVKIKAVYSEAADTFEILDNVSQWWPGFTEDEYLKYWIKNFKLDTNDKKLLKKYSKLREKYYNDPDQPDEDPLKNRNGFFSTLGSINADPMAKAFYSSKTVSSALESLRAVMKTDEIIFLKKFYNNFSSRYLKLINESKKRFPKKIKDLEENISTKKINKYFEQVANFYNLKINITYTVLYVWWPPINRTNASPTGNYLIMRYNPKKHSVSSDSDSDIVMHEIVHTISARQSLKQKRLFTKVFLEHCKINGKVKRYKILEEPLAVIFGQMLYLKKFKPTEFRFDDNWYNNLWVRMLARVFMPIVEDEFNNGKKISSKLMLRLSKMCAETIKASSEISK